MEVELKLLIGSAETETIETHPAFAGAGTAKRRHLVTTYFDTPDLALRRLGASLRIRRTGSKYVQTVKLDDPQADLGARGEWEWPVGSPNPDLAKLDGLPDGLDAVREAAAGAEPLFVTDIERRTWDIETAEGTLIEAAIDRGVARSGDRTADIHEVELELKRGAVGPVIRLAIDLADRAALRYGAQSKAERGYGLVSPDLAPRERPGAPDMPDDTSVGAAFPRLLNAALTTFAAEFPLAGRGDVEGVHRMRAAIRRLRTLLVLFGPNLEAEAAARFNASLQDLGAVLGRGRDWDVFLTETLPRAREASGDASLDLLGPPAEALRVAAHEGVSEAIGGLGPTRLLLGMAAWTTEPGWCARKSFDTALRDALPKMLDRLERKVRKRVRQVDGAEVEPLHDLRKSMKKLRYGSEDVGSLFKHKDVDHYVERIKSTLSVLGEINDAAVTTARIDEAAPPDRPEFAPAAAALLAWNDKRLAKALHKLDGKLHKFKAAENFWD